MANYVMTANGPVAPGELGKTSIHEHLIMAFPGWRFDPDSTFDEKEAVEVLVKDLTEAKAHGLNTIIDAFPYDTDRFPELYREVQQKTGVNIICSTGVFNPGMAGMYWACLMGSRHSADELRPRLVHAMVKDIEVGIDGTDVKAGIIKVSTGTGEALDGFEQLSLSAAGIVQKQTGVPIITHTSRAKLGLEQADMMIANGADPEKVAIGHLCDTDDIDYIESVLAKGVYVNFDRLGTSFDMVNGGNELDKTKVLAELIKRGHGKRIMLGHDSVCLCPGLPFTGKHLNEPASYPEYDISHWHLYGMFEYHIPELRKLGITEDQIEDLLINNPCRFFS